MSKSIFEGNFSNENKSLVAEETKDFANISEVDTESSKNELSHDHLLELLSDMREMMSVSDDDDAEDDSGLNSDHYHNKAVDYARRGRNREAAEICIKGLRKFPYNVDLLADTIKYSSEAGDIRTAADHYSLLKSHIPFQRWNWRAFTFSVEYLLKEDPIANEEECRIIIDNYKKFLPYEEKSSMAESELEAALGNVESSIKVLEKAIQTLTNASQCALRLADMQMDRGLYEKVLTTANYGIAASAEPQPSINIPYLYYLRALAKDYLLHKKELEGEHITKNELETLEEEYELLISEFPELMNQMHTIKMRIKMLKFVKVE